MSRPFLSQCNLNPSKKSSTGYAPKPLFDTRKIAQNGPNVLKDPPLATARKLIKQGCTALKEKNTRAINI